MTSAKVGRGQRPGAPGKQCGGSERGSFGTSTGHEFGLDSMPRHAPLRRDLTYPGWMGDQSASVAVLSRRCRGGRRPPTWSKTGSYVPDLSLASIKQMSELAGHEEMANGSVEVRNSPDSQLVVLPGNERSSCILASPPPHLGPREASRPASPTPKAHHARSGEEGLGVRLRMSAGQHYSLTLSISPRRTWRIARSRASVWSSRTYSRTRFS
jgi:hypothetical protein